MITKDIIVEGPFDFIKKVKGAYAGLKQGYQATKGQQLERDRNKQTADRVYKAWQQELVKHPNISPDQLSNMLVTWTDDRFHDKPGTTVTPPRVGPEDTKDIYNYFLSRTQEYFAKFTATPATAGAGAFGQMAGQLQAQPGTSGTSGTSSTGGTSQQTPTGQQHTASANNPNQPAATPTAPTAPTAPATPTTPTTPAPATPATPTTPAPATPAPATTGTPAASAAAPAGGASPAVKPAAAKPAARPGAVDFSRDASGKLRTMQESRQMIRVINEGGNAIAQSNPVNKEDIATVVGIAKSLIPQQLLKNLQTDIGSAGYKVQSGDIDLMIEANDLVALFRTQESKDPVKEAKQKLKVYFEGKGVEAVVNGRNVSIGIEYKEQKTNSTKLAQVDVMAIHETAIVAPWHQHGLRGQYSDPEFKGSELFMLISSISKFMGLKFDAFSAKLMRRDNNEVVGRSRKEVAKILLNPKAKESDLNSVKSILKALEADADREGKLAQARQDAAKGLMSLPETATPGTAVWFRQMTKAVQ